ncbi:hypothetical protein ABFX02_14G119400 [Erythranthe guttata]
MGRKKGWLSSVKKALNPDSKEKKSEKKSKKKWFGKQKLSVSESPNPEPVQASHPHPQPPLEEVKLTEVENEQQTIRDYSPTVDAVVADEEAEVITEAFEEVVQPIVVTRFAGKSVEEVAAIKIQTAFRGYLAKRALRALRGLVRLKTLVDGPTIKRQTANTLKCMQSLSRVQSQIQSRRMSMLEENRTLQRQLLQKRAKELESLRMGEDWDYSLQSKEQIETSLLHKYEAAMRRERALAYSFTHQQTWKKSAKSTNLLFMDPTNPHWGWSWLERLMANGPLDTQIPSDKDLKTDPLPSMGEITKSFARHQLNSEFPSSPTSRASPARKSFKPKEDDSMSVLSNAQSERNRRHSIAGSSVRDDESLASSPAVPSYMAPTRSAKAKSKLSSPLGTLENGAVDNKGTNSSSPASAKKRLSYSPSPAKPRRHSGPPKVEIASIVDN